MFCAQGHGRDCCTGGSEDTSRVACYSADQPGWEPHAPAKWLVDFPQGSQGAKKLIQHGAACHTRPCGTHMSVEDFFRGQHLTFPLYCLFHELVQVPFLSALRIRLLRAHAQDQQPWIQVVSCTWAKQICYHR